MKNTLKKVFITVLLFAVFMIIVEYANQCRYIIELVFLLVGPAIFLVSGYQSVKLGKVQIWLWIGVIIIFVTYGIWIYQHVGKQEGYLDTGTVVFWEQRYEGTTVDEDCFEYEGERYVEFYSPYSDGEKMRYYEKYLNVEPQNLAFNIRYEPSLFSILHGTGMENMYKVDNPYGFTLFTDEEKLYIKESELNIQ